MSNPVVDRARILFEQNRYSEAADILSSVLSHNPNDVEVLLLMAEIKLQGEEYNESEALITAALGIEPDHGYLHYIRAGVQVGLENYDEAEACLKTAVGLNAYDAVFFAYWAHIKNLRKDYEEAERLADQALAIDPENLLALNARSTAQLKQGKKEESAETIEGALKEDPNDPYTHANSGWGALERGDHKKALEHFAEALKNDPNMEYAQAGMAQALKARYLVYQWFLKYSFWIGNMGAKYQWGVIIGFYIGFRVLRSIASNNEALQPFLNPLLVLIALIAFSTWVIGPISNLFLRFNKYGQHLLDKDEIESSNYVGASAVACLLGTALYFITGDQNWLPVAVYGFTMMVPLSVIFAPAKNKNAFMIYAAVMALVGFISLYKTFVDGIFLNDFSLVYVVGFVAFQWISNFFLIRKDNI